MSHQASVILRIYHELLPTSKQICSCLYDLKESFQSLKMKPVYHPFTPSNLSCMPLSDQYTHCVLEPRESLKIEGSPPCSCSTVVKVIAIAAVTPW